jgi:aminopeptidase YwaD
MRIAPFLTAAAAVGTLAAPAQAQRATPVSEASVRAHEAYLAGPALRGRGSATPDEAMAAAYVASIFRGQGLQHAPGMDSYLQAAQITRLRQSGPASLNVDGTAIGTPTVLIASSPSVSGKLSVFTGNDPAAVTGGEVIVATAPDFSFAKARRSPALATAKLLILPESDDSRAMLGRFGGKPRLPTYLAGSTPPTGPAIITLPADQIAALARKDGATLSLTLPLAEDRSTTTNAIGFLPGSDPKAGVVLVSAHLDHLGVRPDGVVMPGANDDASGTTAVMELAGALSDGKRHRRGILFVCYGSEEIGGFGSRFFGAHPPVPLNDIVANIEVEMIGAQDPKLPAGTMMMTGFERSNLGPALRDHGALVTKDPYPEQDFFRRSDNYSLALKGIVAHTISGWAVVPTYHTPQDTFESLDTAFMTRAIRSLVAPLRWLATSDFKPDWAADGRPME